jgi:hypothetical protein
MMRDMWALWGSCTRYITRTQVNASVDRHWSKPPNKPNKPNALLPRRGSCPPSPHVFIALVRLLPATQSQN